MAKVSLEQLDMWRAKPEKHRRQLADVYNDEESDLHLQGEVVKIWLTQPVVFFAELSEVLDSGEYELRTIVNELLDAALKNDEERNQT